MIAYVFPGQGSQQKGMGKELFALYPEWVREADELLGYSIEDLCLNNPDGRLANTAYTQPALYIVNAFSYRKKVEETGVIPSFTAGHSLGEYNALLAAGAFDFITGLSLVQKRGELMARAQGGGMAAVLGRTDQEVEAAVREHGLGGISIANYNTPTQLVLTGLREDIERAQPVFEAISGTRYIMLNVSGAFHSRYMEPAREEFLAFIDGIQFSQLQLPVISNLHARPYKDADLKRTLADQITGSVRWTESMRYLMGKRVEDIVQVGPGNVLTGMIRVIRKETEPLIIEETAEVVQLEAAAESAAALEVPSLPPQPAAVEEKPANAIMNGALTDAAAALGSRSFKEEYKLNYAYAAGGMQHGIASEQLVIRMAQSGMIGYFGTGGLDIAAIGRAVRTIASALSGGQPFGFGITPCSEFPAREFQTAQSLLDSRIRYIEAAHYLSLTPALVLLRASGLREDADGRIVRARRIMARAARPETVSLFLSPAPERLLLKLLNEGKITEEEMSLAGRLPMADDLCVISQEGGGYWDAGASSAILPVAFKLRDELAGAFGYRDRIHIGTAGGIGTPEAVAAAFVQGCDFISTGYLNQCTVEASTSEAVKDLLQNIRIQDTDLAPAEELFEIGAKVRVLKRGMFYTARANKLYEVYRQFDSIEAIDNKTRSSLEEKVFRMKLDEVVRRCRSAFSAEEWAAAASAPKRIMAIAFKWYLGQALHTAIAGDDDWKLDYQIHCGPASGAFNEWVKGTELADWRNRHADQIGLLLMEQGAAVLEERSRRAE
ncbi:ACP S-malonyltransferase [Paenibacillus kobensis]|uniref:ACP S-malonyltransferase n=1 Tax=Paenibacillus kobensis TaxID=59841 RepID=UPI000FD6D8F3|nr:ACP S-malonyltransferase [Paenibacillus kobensis]